MSEQQKIRSNITNGNFCGANYYVDTMASTDDMTQKCKKCPPGKGVWYEEGPPPRVFKKVDNVEIDQLIQCSGGDTVSSEFIKTLEPNFDEQGPTGVPTWKEAQQAKNIKNCKVDPVTNVVENNETCQSMDRKPPDIDNELNEYYRNYKLFEKCVREKSQEMKAEGEYSLVKQLTDLSKSYINDCLETLPPTNYCDIGYADMFVSAPSIVMKSNGYSMIRDGDQGSYDRTMRHMVRYAYEQEVDACGDVSDQSRSLYNMSNQDVSFQINIGDLWPPENAKLKDYLVITFKWLIISLILYWVVKLIK